MADGKKGLAMLILEHAKKSGKLGDEEPASTDDPTDPEEDPGDGMTEAMGDFMSALKGDDVKAAVEAFRNLCELSQG